MIGITGQFVFQELILDAGVLMNRPDEGGCRKEGRPFMAGRDPILPACLQAKSRALCSRGLQRPSIRQSTSGSQNLNSLPIRPGVAGLLGWLLTTSG
jgi:hypothetical protein